MRGLRIDQPVQLLQGSQHCGDMGKGADDVEGMTDEGFVLQEAPQGLDLFHGPGGKIGALSDLAVFAPSFAQEDGELRLGTMSTYMATYMGIKARCVKGKSHHYMGKFSHHHRLILSTQSSSCRDFSAEIGGNFGLDGVYEQWAGHTCGHSSPMRLSGSPSFRPRSNMRGFSDRFFQRMSSPAKR